MNNWTFFREAVRNFRSTGAIARSSPTLVRRLTQTVPRNRPITVVELGPGEGCVTRALLKRINPQSTLTAFEINAAFVGRLGGIHDTRFRVVGRGAEYLTDYFQPGSVDFVVSSLPLSMIPKEVKEEILAKAQIVLNPEGKFLQYQYALQDYTLLKNYFGRVSVSFTAANLPPAFIYSCSLGLI